MAKETSLYRYSYKEYLEDILKGSGLIIITGLLFYQSIYCCFILSPALYFYIKKKKKERLSRQQWKLNLEFRDGITAISAALCAGYSAEHAFEETLKDLSLIYPKNSMILREFTYMNNQLHMNITAEKVLSEFGNRTGIEDIISFAEVFATAKRSGGDLIQVIRTTGDILSDKLEVKREIITLLAAKKLEAEVMKRVPLGIIGYLLLTSPDFLTPLYHNLAGNLIMTILLLIYMAAGRAVDKIIAIEV